MVGNHVVAVPSESPPLSAESSAYEQLSLAADLLVLSSTPITCSDA
jgi:hypothetical protein